MANARRKAKAFTSAADHFDWDRNPITDVDVIDTSTHVKFTEQEPNALLSDDVRRFLGCMLERFPQLFAVFATGLRPSSLRPIRRKGRRPTGFGSSGWLLIRVTGSWDRGDGGDQAERCAIGSVC